MVTGIDYFAWTIQHETQHYKDMVDFWYNDAVLWDNANKNDAINRGDIGEYDGDFIPNIVERTPPPLNAIYMYDWTSANTPNASRYPEMDSDFNDWDCRRNDNITGDHARDWADPGMQHKTKDKYDD